MLATIPEEFKKKIALCIKVSLLQAKFECDIVEAALQLGLDPLRELENAIKVMNDMKEDGIIEEHVAEILKEIESEQGEGREGGEEDE